MALSVPAWLVEHAIFGEDLADGRAPTRRIVFTEDVKDMACLLWSASTLKPSRFGTCSFGANAANEHKSRYRVLQPLL